MSRATATVLLVVLALLAALASPSATAQRRAPDYLVLARVCAHEAGWDADQTGDCAAIHEVLWRGARREGMSYSAFAMAYSGRALRGETSRSWFADLDERGSEPSTWPRMRTRRVGDGTLSVERVPPWSHYRADWLDLVEYARGIVREDPDVVGVCAGPVHDWGGEMDRERARRIGLVEVDCGDTRNDFYARPSQIQDAPADLVDVE